MSFEEQAALLPQWVQIWMNVLVVLAPLCILVMLIFKATRKPGFVALVLTVLAFGSTILLHGQMGMVRLLGLGHVVFWTPLVIYLFRWQRQNTAPVLPRLAVIVLIVMIVAALVFDYYDVIRWIAGERASIV